MAINYKDIGEFPLCYPRPHTVTDILTHLSEKIEPGPDELQRGQVLSEEWAQGILASVLLRVRIPTFTWSRQAEPYTAENIYGDTINAIYKNLDSLQRYTGLSWFHLDKISVPEKFPPITWNNTQVFLGGMKKSEIETQYPGLLEDRFYNTQIPVDIYGEGETPLTRRQETYLFKYVLNNQNKMNSQQWRNPTNSEVASMIRDDARLKSIPLFKNKLFKFNNNKMDYDEIYAMMVHYILHGPAISLTKPPLDEMYEDPQLENKLTKRSTEYSKVVNVKTYARAYANFMYKILKGEENIKLMDKSYTYSLLYYTHIHMKSGINNLFNYDKLKEQFFDYHLDLVTPPKGITGSTEFRDCLRSNSSDNMKRAMELWEEKLDVETKLKYVIFRDTKRSFSPQVLAQALKQQGGVCAVDGEPLTLNEAVGGHDVAWSKGGLTILDNCIAIRKEYNDDMGTQTLDEYLNTKEEELELVPSDILQWTSATQRSL